MLKNVVTDDAMEDVATGNARQAISVNSLRPVGWLELIGSLLAIAGVLGSVLSGYHAREWQASASDFKTLYASAQCFRQHIDPYDFHNIAAVFAAHRVVPPVSWYAHAPVYPPFTLAVLAPLTLIPMVQAIYLWMALSGILLAAAVFLLTRAAEQLFRLALSWRLALIALFAASPLLSFSLEMGNVSAVVAALLIAAVVLSHTSPQFKTLPPVAVALALLLKPHLALWVVLAFLVSRHTQGRRLAVSSATLFLGSVLCIGLWMAAHHQLSPEINSYRAMVHQEISGGSMDPANHELVAVTAQITSLASLLGYWLTGAPLTLFSATLLLTFFTVLFYFSLRLEKQENPLLLQVGAWSAFGLIATYHRAHDGLILLILLPWLLSLFRQSWKNPVALSVTFLLFAESGPSLGAYTNFARIHGLASIAHFLLYRQSALIAVLLAVILTSVTIHQAAKREVASS